MGGAEGLVYGLGWFGELRGMLTGLGRVTFCGQMYTDERVLLSTVQSLRGTGGGEWASSQESVMGKRQSYYLVQITYMPIEIQMSKPLI